MSHYTERIIKTLVTAINWHTAGNDFTDYNAFSLLRRFRPTLNVDNVPTTGIVIMCPLANDFRKATRSRSTSHIIRVQFGIHFKIANTEDESLEQAEIDNMIQFVEELIDVCLNTNRKDQGDSGVYSFQNADVMTDENDLPFRYDALREHNIFQAIFTASWEARFGTRGLTYTP